MTPSTVDGSGALLALSTDLADLVDRAGRAVVAVNTNRETITGVHWRPGVIVTTDSLLRRDEEMGVTLPGSDRPLPVTLVGRDRSTDLVLLQLPEPALPMVELGDITSLRVGHLVLALGCTLSGGLQASLGMVRGLGGTWRTWSGSQMEPLIQLDLNPGPSCFGSLLVDSQGRGLGLTIPGPRGLVLAIPHPTVNRIVDQLLQQGHGSRGYLGLGMQPVRLPDRLRQQLQLTQTSGAIAITLEPEGPADQAGVLVGDILVAVAGQTVKDTGEVQAILELEPVGKTLNLQVIRGGALLDLAITLGERPYREENYGRYGGRARRSGRGRR